MIPAKDLKLPMISIKVMFVTKAIGLVYGMMRSRRRRTKIFTKRSQSHSDNLLP